MVFFVKHPVYFKIYILNIVAAVCSYNCSNQRLLEALLWAKPHFAIASINVNQKFSLPIYNITTNMCKCYNFPTSPLGIPNLQLRYLNIEKDLTAVIRKKTGFWIMKLKPYAPIVLKAWLTFKMNYSSARYLSFTRH